MDRDILFSLVLTDLPANYPSFLTVWVRLSHFKILIYKGLWKMYCAKIVTCFSSPLPPFKLPDIWNFTQPHKFHSRAWTYIFTATWPKWGWGAPLCGESTILKVLLQDPTWLSIRNKYLLNRCLHFSSSEARRWYRNRRTLRFLCLSQN